MLVYFNNKEFETKKKFEEYIKDLIKNKIGLCESLKSTEYWEEILEFMKRHSEYDEKTKDLKDVIIRESLWGNIELAIINNDNSITTFSYIHAIRGFRNTDKYELNCAMREAIYPQIINYRNNNHLECVNCGELENIQIDHINNFCDLRDNFLKICKIDNVKIPNSFERFNNIRRKFKEEDKTFYSNWIYYHQLNSQLQCLCSKCHKEKTYN